MQITRKTVTHGGMFVVLLAVLGLVCGCTGTEPKGVAVSGTVTLDGQPVTSGSITLLPTDKESKAGSPGGVVKDGAFQIPAEAGPTPGKYKAVVQVMKETGNTVEGPGGTTLPESAPVAIKEAEGVDVEVSAAGPNTFDIKVTSQE